MAPPRIEDPDSHSEHSETQTGQNSSEGSQQADHPAMVKSASTASGNKVRNVNKTYLHEFVDIFRSTPFKNNFNYTRFNANEFCQWITRIGGGADAPDGVRTVFAISDDKLTRHNEKVDKELKGKADKGEETSENSELLKTKFKSVVGVLATQQVRQILRTSLAVHAYAEQDNRIYEMFCKMFRDGDVSPKYVVGTMFLPQALGRGRQKKRVFILKPPTKMEAMLYFHCLQYHVTKNLKITSTMGNRLGYAI